jgi:outer membrane receptor protein involved in Fe transport
MKREVVDRQSLVFIIVILFAAASLALGQGIVTGSISATVLDPQGAVIAGASVRAIQTETNRLFSTTSSTGGVVHLPSLPPGTYNVVVEAQSFSVYHVDGVTVEVGKDTGLGPINVKLGGTAETVTVEGNAPLVESTTDQLSQTFDNKEIANVPLGNTYDSFALFTPGVVTAGSGGFSNNNGAELSINGQRSRSNNYQLDGQNNNDNTIGGPSIFFGNQDNIAELQIVTNFDAEYGRNLGGVVNYITKGGTNDFHGTGYEFWQGDHFDSLQNQEKSPLYGFCPSGVSPATATGPFVGCATPVVPQFVQNQWGGTIGGPIKRDKVWFFGSTNMERQRAGGAPVSSTGIVTPTATGIQQLQAAYPNDPAVTLLSQFGPANVPIGNPTFTGLTTYAVSANSFGPASTIQVGTITRFLSQPFNDYEGTGRVDVQLTSKDRFFGRYIYQKSDETNVPIGSSQGAQGQIYSVPGQSQQIGLDLTHTFSPTLLNQVRFSYSRARSEFDAGGFPSCVLTNDGVCPPEINILDGTELGVGQYYAFPQGRIINIYELQDNASMVHGRHVMKWGGDYDRQRSPNYGLFGQNGVFNYQSLDTFIANTPTANLLAYGQGVLRFKENDVALYFQDDWRVKDNLTLNLGLRWEFYQQASNLLHDESVAQQTGPNHLWDQTLPLSQTTVPQLPNHYRNYGPVIGFAWTPRILESLMGHDRTVVRGGFRIAYDFAYYNLATNVQQTSPFTNAATISNAAGATAGLPSISNLDAANIAAALFPLAPKGNPGVATELQFGTNFRNPYSEQWNLGIQRQITGKMAAEVRYVGNHDLAQYQEINGNPDLLPLINNGFSNVIPAGLTPCTNTSLPGAGFTGTGLPLATDQFGNPVGYANCNFSRVIEYANTGYSIYNGLQTQLRLQNWHGFTGEASYTFSKTIDNTSEAFSTAAGTVYALAQNPFNTGSAERAVSNYNFPNVFTVLWVYDLPFQHQQAGLLGHLTGGWQINGTYRYNSGQPWTVEQSSGQGLCDPANFTNTNSLDTCRPFPGSASAPFNSVGQCTNPAAADCGLVSVNSGSAATPIALNQARFIVNNVAAEQFFGTPFSPLGRNTQSGQPISTINMAVFKNTRVSERVTIQFQAEAFNLFNHQWLGIPIQNVNAAAASELGVTEFGSSAFNFNGGDTFAGNIITDGIGRRRLQFGAKIIF